MLVTFKCHASPDVKMMENLARYLLGLVGKHFGARGVIAQDELPGAIARLEAAIGESQEAAQAQHAALPDHGEHEEVIGLKQRAYPFLDMMRAAQKEGCDILWGL